MEVLREQCLCFFFTFCDFTAFFSFDKSNDLIFQMCFVSTTAYDCPNKIKFDVVDLIVALRSDKFVLILCVY